MTKLNLAWVLFVLIGVGGCDSAATTPEKAPADTTASVTPPPKKAAKKEASGAYDVPVPNFKPGKARWKELEIEWLSAAMRDGKLPKERSLYVKVKITNHGGAEAKLRDTRGKWGLEWKPRHVTGSGVNYKWVVPSGETREFELRHGNFVQTATVDALQNPRFVFRADGDQKEVTAPITN